jgi:hypothetical protein
LKSTEVSGWGEEIPHTHRKPPCLHIYTVGSQGGEIHSTPVTYPSSTLFSGDQRGPNCEGEKKNLFWDPEIKRFRV